MIKPMLAELAHKPFDDPGMIWEEKYDGIRAITHASPTQPYRIFARSGSEKTELFPELRIQTKMPCILDGEIISGNGFNSIQHRVNRVRGIAQAVEQFPAVYKVFDVLEICEKDVRRISLEARKKILAELLIPTDNVMVAPYTDQGEALFEQAVAEGREGVIGKRLNGVYQEGKRIWIKVKCNQVAEFIICGFTQGTGWRESTFGALLLGKEENGKLTYVGSVGTGFTMKHIAHFNQLLRESIVQMSPFGYNPEPVPVTWVLPQIRIFVRFLEYTNDGKLRFPAYLPNAREGK